MVLSGLSSMSEYLVKFEKYDILEELLEMYILFSEIQEAVILWG